MATHIAGQPNQPVATLAQPTSRKARSLWQDAARTFARNRAGMVGLVYALILLFVAVCAPIIAPYDPNQQEWTALRQPPSLPRCPSASLSPSNPSRTLNAFE